MSLCHYVTVSLCHCVTVSGVYSVAVSLCHFGGNPRIQEPRIQESTSGFWGPLQLYRLYIGVLCHCVTVSGVYSVAVSLCHCVTVSLCYCVTVSGVYSVCFVTVFFVGRSPLWGSKFSYSYSSPRLLSSELGWTALDVHRCCVQLFCILWFIRGHEGP